MCGEKRGVRCSFVRILSAATELALSPTRPLSTQSTGTVHQGIVVDNALPGVHITLRLLASLTQVRRSLTRQRIPTSTSRTMVFHVLLLSVLLPYTLSTPASGNKNPTGYTYCTGDNLTGTCTYTVVTGVKCIPISGGKGSLNVFPGAACILYEDEKCTSAVSSVVSGLDQGAYVPAIAAWKLDGKSYVWKGLWCGLVL